MGWRVPPGGLRHASVSFHVSWSGMCTAHLACVCHGPPARVSPRLRRASHLAQGRRVDGVRHEEVQRARPQVEGVVAFR